MPAKFQAPALDGWRFMFGFFDSGFSWVWHILHDGELWLCLVNLEKRTCTELPPLSLSAQQRQTEPIVLHVGQVKEGLGDFYIPVLLRCNDDLCVARYISGKRGGVGKWATEYLSWFPQVDRTFVAFSFSEDSYIYRVFILCAYGQWLPNPVNVPAHLGTTFWRLDCFDIRQGNLLCRGFLPTRFISSQDHFVPPSRGVFCIRWYDGRGLRYEGKGKAFTVRIFSWNIMLPGYDPYSADVGDDSIDISDTDQLMEMLEWRRVSVLSAKHLDPEM